MKWTLYPPQTLPEKEPIPWPGILLAYILVIGLFLVITISDWPDNKPVDFMFYTQGMVLPFLFVSMTISYIVMGKSTYDCYHFSRWNIAQWRLYHLKNYAQQHLIIAAWSSKTPVDELTLRMIQLKGDLPLAPRTPLRMALGGGFETTPARQLFSQLVAPIVETLRAYPNFKVSYWLRNANELTTGELRDVLSHCAVTFEEEIIALDKCPDFSLLNKTFADSEQRWDYRHLLIIGDLYGKEENKCMENGSVLFICQDFQLKESLKPVFLFQPLTGVDELEKSAAVFIEAQQPTEPKTLWFTGLTAHQKYPFLNVLNEYKTVPLRLELELSFGESSAGYRWLALALAADAARYGQGAQLVAASEKNMPEMVLLSTERPRSPLKPGYDGPGPLSHIAHVALTTLATLITGWAVYFKTLNWTTILICTCSALVISFALSFLLTHMAINAAEDDLGSIHH